MNTEGTNVDYRQSLVWLGVFAAAMGVLEAIVVVYLRELYHPAGFRFPMTAIPQNALLIEMLRETCTIVMIAAVAAAVSRSFVRWFAFFAFTFGIWDILYYLALKLLLDWPSSFLTWDILFLIPVTWTGPVLASLIVSLTLVGLGLLFAYLHQKYGTVRMGAAAWALMGLGAFVIFLTFIWDYSKIIIEGGFLPGFPHLFQHPSFQAAVSAYEPRHYHWTLFFLGEMLIVSAVIVVYRKTAHRDGNA